MDIRHPLKEYDRHMLTYAVERGIPAHALLTKADKLGRGQQANALQAVKKELFSAFGDTVSVQTFSGESKQGVDEARAVVNGWLGYPPVEVKALRMRLHFLLLLCACLWFPGVARADEPDRRIAVTIDDLPWPRLDAITPPTCRRGMRG